MDSLIIFALFLPTAVLVAVGCLPGWLVASHPRTLRRCVTWLAAAQAAIAACLVIAVGSAVMPTTWYPFVHFSTELPLSISVYIDGVAALMFALVAFVGWVIFRFSMRYLDGESGEGRYYRWASFTLGSVCVMVVSGNLLMFITAWVMTSLGLHQLLLHYGDRPAARRAAWTKFTISRIGDAALITAMVLIYRQFGTLDFPELFVRSRMLESPTLMTMAAGFLLVIGAITKSAQFPFHTWLPLTMETPTPVSALMHAGIVNAGGYLMIRTSPLVSLTPSAMTLLALVGGVTACYAAIVMVTQTSVKKSLAYSTIAQMGFMLLQCGLGAYSAAMLHIIAHSLYKGHAFLSSGTVLSSRPATQDTDVVAARSSSLPATMLTPTMLTPTMLTPTMLATSVLATTLLAAITSLALFGAACAMTGLNPATKPGGLLLGGILCLALTHWMSSVLRSGDAALFLRSLVVGGGLCLTYTVSYLVVNSLVSPSLPADTLSVDWGGIAAIIAIGFVGLFLLQLRLSLPHRSARLDRWQIHAANGFYVESALRRVFGPIVFN